MRSNARARYASNTKVSRLAKFDVVSIEDLETSDIERIFALADGFADQVERGDPITTAAGLIMATLFYEPSTRTRLSFESSMHRLGGAVISSADMQASSAAKGESLADTVRVVAGYADLIVLRHPHDGAARVAAEYAPCPVLTVGPQACHEAGRRGRMSSILFATDFGAASLAAAPIAVSLAEECQAKLTLLHVMEKRSGGQMEMPCDASEKCEERLRALVAEEAKMWCEPHFVVDCGAGDRAGAAWERILWQAQAREADLIVMGVHGPEGAFSGADTHLEIATVHGVVAHARVPVLTVRGEARN